MRVLKAFLAQPCHRYLAFQLVFAGLAANFILPALSYAFAPDQALEQYLMLNSALGSVPYLHDERTSMLWRILAAANVMTLGAMCLMLMADLRRFFAVLYPLTFMKSCAAAGWWLAFAMEPGTRVFAAAALLDTVTSAAFVFFATRAHCAMADVADADLVPRPGWWHALAGT